MQFEEPSSGRLEKPSFKVPETAAKLMPVNAIERVKHYESLGLFEVEVQRYQDRKNVNPAAANHLDEEFL